MPVHQESLISGGACDEKILRSPVSRLVHGMRSDRDTRQWGHTPCNMCYQPRTERGRQRHIIFSVYHASPVRSACARRWQISGGNRGASWASLCTPGRSIVGVLITIVRGKIAGTRPPLFVQAYTGIMKVEQARSARLDGLRNAYGLRAYV